MSLPAIGTRVSITGGGDLGTVVGHALIDSAARHPHYSTGVHALALVELDRPFWQYEGNADGSGRGMSISVIPVSECNLEIEPVSWQGPMRGEAADYGRG